MKTVGYIRASSEGQNIARQKKSLKEAGCTKFYIEKLSGASMEGPELQRMLEELEAGDMVIIHEMSRLSQSTKDLLVIVETIKK
ncbi:recombinase family protein [Peribacillus frigoritolerans]|uniref:recombinase family protein n=1 Tax=Peribacillus frigoritolerans TaxID=450367 RepID=UPI002B255051|nr:recombinase family protein [Peribacillus frigoritolerans]MEB2492866.1 recombinase family protein [Peribacillus frigoritolerans]